MLYALYSEGFRPGGTNRARGNPCFPVQYEADLLKNYEMGFKGRFMDGRVQLNVTAFFMSWDDYQLEIVDPSKISCGEPGAVDPCGQAWQKVVANVGNASSDGLEISFAAIPGEGWSISGNAMWVNAELDESVDISVPVPAGSRLPIAPKFKGSLQVEYAWGVDWFGANEAYLRGQYSYNGDSLNQIEPLPVGTTNTPQVRADSYSISDLTFGLTGADGSWEAQLFIKNLTDERSNSFAYVNSMDWFFGRQRFVVNRPREFGIRFTKSWQ
jgi:outer membrane receptor protein involved in Fe transport